MATNRYSNLSQAKFNPLGFEALSVLPFHMRKQHDAAAAQAEQAGIIKSQRMAVDEEVVSNAINAFQAKTDDYINRLDSEGFSNTTKSDIRDLVRERKELMSPTGIVGRKQAQYDKYTANMKQLDKQYEKGEIDPIKYQLSKNMAVQNYNQAVSKDPNATYQDFLAVKNHDIQKDALKIANDVTSAMKTNTFTKFGFEPIKGAPGQYMHRKTQTKYKKADAISKAIQDVLGANQDVQMDLAQRQQLGMFGENTADDYLKSVADKIGSAYEVNQSTISKTGFTNQMELDSAKKKIDESNNTNVPYSFKPAESFKIQQESFLNKVGDVAKGGTIKKYDDTYGMFGVYHIDKEATPENVLDEKELQRYNNIKEKMLKEGLLDENDTEIQSSNKIKQYLDAFKDVPYQNPLIEPNSNVGKLSSSLLLDTKDVNSTNRNITNKINDGRMKLWDEKGNPISVDDLPKGYKVEYTGYIGPTNLLPTFKNADSSQSVAPHQIQIKDKDGKFVNSVYGSRNEFERNTPEFRAYSRIKSSINVNMAEPGLPETFDVTTDPKLSKMLSRYESAYDPIKKTYTLKLYDREGNLKEENYNMPENKLQDKWHLIYKLLD